MHNGHLLLAMQALEALKLDELIFIPCAESADRKKLLPSALRLKILKAAIRGIKKFRVSSIEIKKGGVSRSIDTVESLKDASPRGSRFYLLIGEDQAQRFPGWKDAGRLSKLAKVCVMARPGFRKLPLIHKKFHFRAVEVSRYEISSSQIRNRIQKKLPLNHLLPDSALSILKSRRSNL